MTTLRRPLLSAFLLTLSACCATQRVPPPQPSVTPAVLSQAPCRPGDALIGAALWVRSSAEYQAAMSGSYAVARERLDQALADQQWSAIGSTASHDLPPAVILDSDETIFDNIDFEGQAIASGKFYDDDAWNRWVDRAAAGAVPGAVEFVQYAQKRGVKVFFVTNRGKAQETVTRTNLEKLGVQLPANEDTVLVRGERPEWNSGDKSGRRDYVAARHRVLLLIGDDLNDFVAVSGRTPDERDALVRDASARWGRQWIMLPNPMYGSWNPAATGRLGDECAEYRRKIELLTP